MDTLMDLHFTVLVSRTTRKGFQMPHDGTIVSTGLLIEFRRVRRTQILLRVVVDLRPRARACVCVCL